MDKGVADILRIGSGRWLRHEVRVIGFFQAKELNDKACPVLSF